MTLLQLADVMAGKYAVVKDKYNRQYGGVNHGRSVLFDPVRDLYLKVFHPEYCRLPNFRKALARGFFSHEIFQGLAGLICAGDAVQGYIMHPGQPLAPVGDETPSLIPQPFFDKVVTHCRAHAMAFYDLVPQNVIRLANGVLSLIDLESLYEFSEISRMKAENATFKPAELPKLLGIITP